MECRVCASCGSASYRVDGLDIQANGVITVEAENDGFSQAQCLTSLDVRPSHCEVSRKDSPVIADDLPAGRRRL